SWTTTRPQLQAGQQNNPLLFRYLEVMGADAGPAWEDTPGGTQFVESEGNVIDAGAGDDYVVSGTGDDIAAGGDGDDDMIGLDGDDLLLGDAGDDFLLGDGTQGDDYVHHVPLDRHGADTLLGGAGHDILIGQGGADELYGGEGDDKLWSDDDHSLETPSAYHGNDWAEGGSGDDDITGGGRNDTLLGGTGNDRLWGDNGHAVQLALADHGKDYLDAGDGDDYAAGGGNDDELHGGEGNDTMLGDDVQTSVAVSDHGKDYLDGEGGNDLLAGGGNDDTLFGGEGNDQLQGDDLQGNLELAAHGNDLLDGEAGDDTVIGGGGADELYGGAGHDLLRGDDRPENVEASAHGNDTMDGGEGNDTLFGGGGSDLVMGGAGDDGLAGDNGMGADDGNDTLIGGAGVDYLSGGQGDDLYRFAAGDSIVNALGQADTIADAHGNNRLQLEGIALDAITAEAHGADLHLRYGDEAIVVTDGLASGIQRYDIGGTAYTTAQLFGLRANAPITITRADGSTQAMGGSGNDVLLGNTLADQLSGGLGNDTMAGGAGGDRYEWGAGLGDDVIDDADAQAASVDTLRIAGAMPEDVIVTRAGTDLRLRLATGDTATILGFFAAAASVGIDRLEFDDGTVWDRAAMAAHVSNALGEGPDTYTGSADNDLIDGLGGDDTLFGADGNDSIAGGAGQDVLHGDAGADTLDGGAGSDSLDGGAGADTYRFALGGGNDLIADSGVDGAADKLLLGAGITMNNVRIGGLANPVLTLLPTGEQIRLGPNSLVERIEFADRRGWNHDQILLRAARDATTEGDDNLEAFAGSAADIHTDGKAGNDHITFAGPGRRHLQGGAGDDVLTSGSGTDTLEGGAGYDRLYAGDGNDVLKEGEFMYGGKGGDTYEFATWQAADIEETLEAPSAAEAIDAIVLPANITPEQVRVERDFNDYTHGWDDVLLRTGAAGSAPIRMVMQAYNDDPADMKIEEVRFADGTTWADLIGRLVNYQKTNQADDIKGQRWGETIDALGGNDTVQGYFGDDELLGGEGDDLIYGDAYVSWADVRDGNDTLDGDAGRDTLLGGGGDDRYQWRRGVGNDTVIDAGGVDTLALGPGIAQADVALYRAGADLVVVLDGSATQLIVAGHFDSADTALESVAFADGSAWDAAQIAGRTAAGNANAMTGTAGNDLFLVDDTLDTIAEGVDAGTDSVQASVSYILPDNVENLTLTGPLNLEGTGNRVNNVITGNAAANVLRGAREAMLLNEGTGADTLAGGAGDDTYWVNTVNGRATSDEVDDVVVEAEGEGTDTVHVWGYAYTLPAHVENLVDVNREWAVYSAQGELQPARFTGNARNNVIDHGGARLAPGWLDGGAGADTMIGGSEGDTYVVDDEGDVVVETEPGGVRPDTVRAGVSFKLGAFLESLILIGAAATRGEGNAQANLFASVNGAANTLVGGAGDDRYEIDALDAVTELAGESEGEDTVTILQGTAGATYGLASYAHVENLTLGEALGAANAIGDAGANVLIGNRYANLLEGGAGNDTLQDNLPGNNGFDQDTLLGGAGDDTLRAISGSDELDGGAGDDTLIDGGGAWTVRFGAGDGRDTFATSAPASRARVQFDAGVAASQVQVRRDNADVVLSLGDSDSDSLRLIDFYADAQTVELRGVIDAVAFDDGSSAAAARVDEVARGLRTDLVEAPQNEPPWLNLLLTDFYAIETQAFSYTIAPDLMIDIDPGDTVSYWIGMEDHAPMPGWLTFDAATRTLAGTPGSSDSGVLNLAIEGTDNHGATNAVPLAMHVLNIVNGTSSANTLTGTSQADAIFGLAGNDTLNGAGGDDSLVGGLGNDSLSGGAGWDTLDGSEGTDTLAGGTGDDVYRLARGHGADTIVENDATEDNEDSVRFGPDIAIDQLWFRRVSNNLEVSIVGTSDKMTVTNWYLGNQYKVEIFEIDNGDYLEAEDVQGLVNAMAAFKVPAKGPLTLPAHYSAALEAQIAASWV
ncbi:calcium-binding protein, partial [Ramlibacter sp.]|uniref:calcium-binding protein n=1 Tax=Ramlibacter sp. TaxID=1917967 RepID=UPI003D0E7E11